MKTRHFDRSARSSVIERKDLYFAAMGVHSEIARIFVALSAGFWFFKDLPFSRWYEITHLRSCDAITSTLIHERLRKFRCIAVEYASPIKWKF